MEEMYCSPLPSGLLEMAATDRLQLGVCYKNMRKTVTTGCVLQEYENSYSWVRVARI
jgi:hypothetical protein